MFQRLTLFLTTKPTKAVTLFVTLVTVLILVVAVAAIEPFVISSRSPSSKTPYPNEGLPLSLVNGSVVFTNWVTWGGTTYSGTKIGFRMGMGSGWEWVEDNLGNQSLLSSGHRASVNQTLLFEDPYMSVDVNVTDSNGDGGFGAGDSIKLRIVPLQEDRNYSFALLYTLEESWWPTEMSFAIHDGKLYSWFSHLLGHEGPGRAIPIW